MADQSIQFARDAISSALSATQSNKPATDMVETMPVTVTEEDVCKLMFSMKEIH